MNNPSLFQLLTWDSIFFKYKVAKISISKLNRNELKKLLSRLSDLNVKLVYWFVDPTDEVSNRAAKYNNGFLADNKITYKIDLSNVHPKKIDKQHLHSYLNKPINKQLLFLALQSGFYSRFKRDKKFVHNEFTRLYKTWIERSVKGEIAIDVIVYIDNDIEEGLITLEIKDDCGSIGLLVVDKKYQGKSVGSQLINAAFVEFKKYGIRKVQVKTQKKNAIACKFYEKIGFTLDKIQNVYHFWLNE